LSQAEKKKFEEYLKKLNDAPEEIQKAGFGT